MSYKRLQDLVTFYSILTALETRIGGARTLASCRGRMQWPARSVYFFHSKIADTRDVWENLAHLAGNDKLLHRVYRSEANLTNAFPPPRTRSI